MQQIETSTAGNKSQRVRDLFKQIDSLIDGEPDLIANLSNICAALRMGFGYFWVGFYLVKGEELVLGPFQGPVACTRIPKGRGVCGAAWEQGNTILVPDVEKFPGHIACSSQSKSEIVVPVIKDGRVTMVLDVDSDRLDDFDEHDRWLLESVAKRISSIS